MHEEVPVDASHVGTMLRGMRVPYNNEGEDRPVNPTCWALGSDSKAATMNEA